jgi:hypothetical protein
MSHHGVRAKRTYDASTVTGQLHDGVSSLAIMRRAFPNWHALAGGSGSACDLRPRGCSWPDASAAPAPNTSIAARLQLGPAAACTAGAIGWPILCSGHALGGVQLQTTLMLFVLI